MKDSISHYWERFSRREKIVCLAAAFILLLYAAYAFVLENSLRDAMTKRLYLTRLNAEYQSLRESRPREEDLKGGLTALTRELENKMTEEKLLIVKGAESGRTIEALLLDLRETAGGIPLQNVDMDIKTDVVSKTGDGALRTQPEVVNGNAPKAIQAETANYTVSKIKLTYQSSYAETLAYFLKVMDLPYAISVSTVEMERSGVSATGIGGIAPFSNREGAPDGKRPLLKTKLGLEIIY